MTPLDQRFATTTRVTLRRPGRAALAFALAVGCGAGDPATPLEQGDNTGGASGVSVGGASGVSAGGGNVGSAIGNNAGAGVAGLGQGGITNVGGTTGLEAGTAGGGGSGGKAPVADSGAIPHSIAKCDGLGAVGEWQKITPNDFTTHDFVVDPLHAGTVYLGCAGPGDPFKAQGVWKSTDCGATWAKVSTGTNSEKVNAGAQWGFAIDPVNLNTLYTTSGYGWNGFYKSTNGGVDWTDITPKGDGAPGFVAQPDLLDPDDPLHVFVTWHAPCGKYEDQIGCFAESKDGGVTWIEHYGSPAWSPEVRVYPLHGKTWIVPNKGLLRTSDGGASWTKVSDLGAGGHSAGTLYRAMDGSYYIGGGNGVIRSADDGVTWSAIANTGSVVKGVIGNGKQMFACGTGNGIVTAAESDGTKWTHMTTPLTAIEDGCFLKYDRDHHLLYASVNGVAGSHGFWRVVTE